MARLRYDIEERVAEVEALAEPTDSTPVVPMTDRQ